MNSPQRKRVQALERRRDLLAQRLTEKGYRGDPDRQRAELGAINWALRIIRAAERTETLHDLENTPA